MQMILENFGWILLLLAITFVFVFERLTGDMYALTSKYRTTVSLRANTHELPNKVIRALKKAGFRRPGHDLEENRFYAQGRVSFWSWGEFIEIKVEEEKDQLKLNFTSMCALPTQMIDWGKNKRNARKFLKELDKEIEVAG